VTIKSPKARISRKAAHSNEITRREMHFANAVHFVFRRNPSSQFQDVSSTHSRRGTFIISKFGSSQELYYAYIQLTTTSTLPTRSWSNIFLLWPARIILEGVGAPFIKLPGINFLGCALFSLLFSAGVTSVQLDSFLGPFSRERL
jgi:hypothetical protein